ncbi:hypothetical protein NIES4074_00980 [Cylindrospermum sp. NIES-4074]|nr:hypothetical protein NIES4074_00980 [Cylindrospermum sp. NIES-4074]
MIAFPVGDWERDKRDKKSLVYFSRLSSISPEIHFWAGVEANK